MRIHPSFPTYSFTPLIVCGRQRAGTRFITSVLNKSKRACIQPEIPPQITKRFVGFIEDCESFYKKQAASGDSRRERQFRTWQNKKATLIFNMWAGISQDNIQITRSDNLEYYGYKRPAHEELISFYERHFINYPKKPIYIYCVRNFLDNYLSINSRWPEKDITTVADQFRESIQLAKKWKSKLKSRFFVFDLDKFKSHGASYVNENILSPLMIDGSFLPDLLIKPTEPKLLATNATPKEIRRLPSDLSATELNFIKSNSDLIKLLDQI